MPKKSQKKGKASQKPTNLDGGEVAISSKGLNVEYYENPVKRDTDKNEYRVIKLPNGLVALLISCGGGVSDDDSHKNNKLDDDGNEDYPEWYKNEIRDKKDSQLPSCYLCINVGRFSDPRQVAGVSRILSAAICNPVFRKQTETPDYYKKLVEDRTMSVANKGESTVFSFDAADQMLPGAINFFVQSFISSLTTRDSVMDQKRNMESTYVDGDEPWYNGLIAIDNLLINLLSARHPVRTCANSYLAGFSQTSDDKMYKEVLKFRKRHYSAHRMTVIIESHKPLDILESYATDNLSKIPSNDLPPLNFNAFNFANSFDNTKFRRIWEYNDDYHQAAINWIMPPKKWLYRSKSTNYIAWLINHTGKGSLVDYLKKKTWILNLHAGSGDTDVLNNSIYSIFSVQLELTEEGHKNIKSILDALYSYINLLKLEGIQERIYNEIAIIEEAKFRFLEVSDPFINCQRLAMDTHLYSSDDYLTGPFYYYEYDPLMISTCMDLMTPMKGCIMVNVESFSIFTNDASLGCKVVDEYQCAEIPEDYIEHWKIIDPMPEFNIPPVNIFCPDNLTLIDPPELLPDYPSKVYSDNMCELWYKFDTKFRLPKCYINLCYVSALQSKSVENAVMLDLYTKVLRHLMNEELYPTTFAELKYYIEVSVKGLVITVSGLSQKLPLLMQTIVMYIPECGNLLTKSLFDDVKSKYLTDLSEELRNTIKLAEDIRMSIVIVDHWTICDKRASLESLEFDKFQNFLKHYLDHVYVECLAQGNISEADATENIRKCVEISKCGSPLASATPLELNINEIPRGRYCCEVKTFYPDDTATVVNHYYQFANPSMTLSVMIDLLIMIWPDNKFCVNNKYSDEILAMPDPKKDTFGGVGYHLHWFKCSKSMTDTKQLIAFMEEELDERRKVVNRLSKNLSDNEWQWMKKIMLHAKTDNRLCDEFKRNWQEISTGEYFFDRQARAYDVISGLKLEDFRKWMLILTDDELDVRKLSVHVIAGKKVKHELSTAKVQPNSSSAKGQQNLADAKVQEKKGNTEADSKKTARHRLEDALGEFPKPKEMMPYYYITDIKKYKSELKVLTMNRNAEAK